jgi:hypothetical protein
MDLMHELLDQGLCDRNGDRCGRVDDVEVEEEFDRPARVVAILSGGGVKSRWLGRWAHRFSIWLHKALGVPPPIEPARVAWEDVEEMNAHVTLKISAADAGLDRLNQAVAERIIGHIPGAK